MGYALLSAACLAAACFLIHSAFVRPRKPLPPDIDGAYLVIPALAFVAGGVVFGALACGATWSDIEAAITILITNAFAIV